MKKLTLEHVGFKITGMATILLWDGGVGDIQMDPFFIPDDKFSHTNIKRSINDAGYRCKAVLSARVHIYDQYAIGYTQYNRSILLSKHQCQEACIGIKNPEENYVEN